MTAALEHRSSVIGHRIVRGALVIIFFGLFLKLGGLLMYWLLNHYYGTGPALDAFTAVYGKVIVLLFYSSMVKVLVPAFMPLFAEQRHNAGEPAAWELANTLCNLTLLGGAACTAVAIFFAPSLASILFPKFTPETHDLAVGILRWMAPGLVIQFFAIMSLGLLNSYKIFSYPSAAEATQKLVWAAGIFVAISLLKFSKASGNVPMVVGGAFLIGCLAQLGVLLAGIGRERLRLYRPSLPLVTAKRLGIEAAWLAGCAALFAGWAWLMGRLAAEPGWLAGKLSFDEGDRSFFTITGLIGAGCVYCASLWVRGRRGSTLMARLAVLCAPLIVGVLFARYRDLVFASFQTYTGEGNFGVIELASKVAGLPGVLVAYSLSIAMFPYLCDMAARKDTSHHGAVVGGSVRMLGAVLLPLTAVLIVLSAPVMQLLFDKGQWGPEELWAAQTALAVISTGIFFVAIENVLMQAFFSMQQMVLPTLLGIIISVGSSLALYALIEGAGLKTMAFMLVCIAYPYSRAVKNLLLLYFVNRREPLMRPGEGWSYVGRLTAICAAVGGAAWVAHAAALRLIHLKPALFTGGMARVKMATMIELCMPTLCALAVYIALMALLRMEEMRLVVDYVRRRGWKLRGKGGAAANGEG